MFSNFSFGKADVFFGGGILAGMLSFIPKLKEILQIMLLIAGVCSAIASFWYYRAATKKINESKE